MYVLLFFFLGNNTVLLPIVILLKSSSVYLLNFFSFLKVLFAIKFLDTIVKPKKSCCHILKFLIYI